MLHVAQVAVACLTCSTVLYSWQERLDSSASQVEAALGAAVEDVRWQAQRQVDALSAKVGAEATAWPHTASLRAQLQERSFKCTVAENQHKPLPCLSFSLLHVAPSSARLQVSELSDGLLKAAHHQQGQATLSSTAFAQLEGQHRGLLAELRAWKDEQQHAGQEGHEQVEQGRSQLGVRDVGSDCAAEVRGAAGWQLEAEPSTGSMAYTSSPDLATAAAAAAAAAPGPLPRHDSPTWGLATHAKRAAAQDSSGSAGPFRHAGAAAAGQMASRALAQLQASGAGGVPQGPPASAVAAAGTSPMRELIDAVLGSGGGSSRDSPPLPGRAVSAAAASIRAKAAQPQSAVAQAATPTAAAGGQEVGPSAWQTSPQLQPYQARLERLLGGSSAKPAASLGAAAPARKAAAAAQPARRVSPRGTGLGRLVAQAETAAAEPVSVPRQLLRQQQAPCQPPAGALNPVSRPGGAARCG